MASDLIETARRANDPAMVSAFDAACHRIGPMHATRVPNPSGIVPMDKRVLVRPDAVEEVTSGGIIIPKPHADREQMAQTKATVIAVGETAWSEAMHDARNFGVEFQRPQPGDRVMIAKYSGGVDITGADGAKYRILNDEDVTARLEE